MIPKFLQTLQSHFRKWDNFALVCWATLVSVLNALKVGPDFFWDNLNYHIYNAYAALHNRIDIDIIPAGIHSFFNPNADFYYYFLLKTFSHYPHIVVMLQSVWYAICLFTTLKILKLAMPARQFNLFSILTTTLLFLFAPAIFGYGSLNTGDMFSCCFIILSIYYLFVALRDRERPHTGWLLAAGGCFGLAFSLKYTSVPFLLAYIVMFCFCFRSFRQWLQSGLWFTLAAVTTFLTTSGWWLYKMYIHFKNPFFPFLNSWFQSPYFAPVDLVDKRFFTGKTIWDILLTPFTMLRNSRMNAIEGWSRNYLYLALLIAVIILCVYIYQHRSQKQKQALFSIWKKLIIFALSSYLFWMIQFMLLRYAMPLEAVSSILITLVLFVCVRGANRILYIALITGLLSFSCVTYRQYYQTPDPLIQLSHTPMQIFTKRPVLFQPGAPQIEDGSVVILQGWSLSFIIPFLNPRARYVGGLQPNINDYPLAIDRLDLLNHFSFSHVFFEHNFAPKIHQAIQEAPQIYVMMWDNQPAIYRLEPLKHYGVQIDARQCTRIETKWWGTLTILCKANKL